MDLRIEAFTDNCGKTYFKVSVKGKDGASSQKTVGYEALLKMLDSSYRTENVSIAVGELPGGYLDCKIEGNGAGIVRVYVPGKVRYFALDVGEAMPAGFHVPMPSMVFEVQVSASGATHGKVHCVKGTYEEVKEAYYKGKLDEYAYPFGNVQDSGDVCMGNIRLKMNQIKEVSTFVDAFFDGVTNSDYIGSSSRVLNKMNQYELLQFLEGKRKFPEEILKKTGIPFMKEPLA